MTFWTEVDSFGSVETADANELAALLAHLHTEKLTANHPTVVTVFSATRPDPDPWDDDTVLAAVQIGLGHPHRAFVWNVEYAVEAGLSRWPEGIWFDFGGTGTEYLPVCTQITPSTAISVAREFMIADGLRPETVSWQSG